VIIAEDLPLGPRHALTFEDPVFGYKCSISIHRRDLRSAREFQLVPGQLRVSTLRGILETSLPRRSANRTVRGTRIFEKPSPENIKRLMTMLRSPRRDPTVQFMRLVYEAFYGSFNRTIDWIRDNLGQYWLGSLPPYVRHNDDIGEIGRFLEEVNAAWSFDGKGWSALRFPLVSSIREVRQTNAPVTESDWSSLENGIARINLTQHLVSRSLALFEARDYRTALITMVTALDREVSACVTRIFAEREITLTEAQVNDMIREVGLSFLIKAFIPGAINDRVLSRLAPSTREAVNTRNLLVHGHQREIDVVTAREHLHSCFQFLQRLCPMEFRQPAIFGWGPI
jgi:hypothetical protein